MKAFLKNKNDIKNIKVAIASNNIIIFNFLLFENEQKELVKIVATEKYTDGMKSKRIISLTDVIELGLKNFKTVHIITENVSIKKNVNHIYIDLISVFRRKYFYSLLIFLPK